MHRRYDARATPDATSIAKLLGKNSKRMKNARKFRAFPRCSR
jgi:hypothetical protein